MHWAGNAQRASGDHVVLPTVSTSRSDQGTARAFGSETLDHQSEIVAVAVPMAKELSRGQSRKREARSEFKVIGHLVVREVRREGRLLMTKEGHLRPSTSRRKP